MVLFRALFRSSVFSLRFPFYNHVKVFSCEISSVCHLKYPYNCFSSDFYFLVIAVLLVFMVSVLLLTIVTSLSLLFLK